MPRMVVEGRVSRKGIIRFEKKGPKMEKRIIVMAIIVEKIEIIIEERNLGVS